MSAPCPNCNVIAYPDSGICEHGQWTFHRWHDCLICGQPCQIESVIMGFGSVYDTGRICPTCAASYIDTAIRIAQTTP